MIPKEAWKAARLVLVPEDQRLRGCLHHVVDVEMLV